MAALVSFHRNFMHDLRKHQNQVLFCQFLLNHTQCALIIFFAPLIFPVQLPFPYPPKFMLPPHQYQFVLSKYSWTCGLPLMLLTYQGLYSQRKLTVPLPDNKNFQLLLRKA